MRVAVMADIHGNLPALEAVLADIDSVGVDAIVVNGDIATGPMPAETLDLLAALGDRVVWVHGNAERELVAAFDGAVSPDLTGPALEATLAAAPLIGPRHRDLIDGLPLSVTLDVDSLGTVRFCHATLRSDTEIVLVDSPMEHFAAGFPDAPEDVFVLGHTHMPFDRLADRRRFVNPGSVGMPYGTTAACWALLGPTVELRRTAYDLTAAAHRLRSSSRWSGIDEFVEENLLVTPSDSEALEVFTTMAARQRAATPT